MTEYKKHEFCKKKFCIYLDEAKDSCERLEKINMYEDDNDTCVYTAREFHDFLSAEGYSITKGSNIGKIDKRGIQEEITETIMFILHEYPRIILHTAFTPRKAYVPEQKVEVIKNYQNNNIFNQSVNHAVHNIMHSIERWEEDV